jgi:hypothetical protein
MIRRALLQPIATTLVALLAIGCSDATEPSAVPRQLSLPPGPGLQVDIFPSTAVRYTNGGVMDITDAVITEVDGQPYAGGNSGNFPAGSTLKLTGTYSITASGAAGGEPFTAYLGWNNDFGWPNYLLATVAYPLPALPVTGTFAWVTKAPALPGTWPIGAAQVNSSRYGAGSGGFTGQSLLAGDDPTLPDASFVITVDKPGIFPVITKTGTVNAAGWYNGNVTVSWDVVYPAQLITSKTGCAPVTIDADTKGQVVTCSVDSDGDVTSSSVTIKRDATDPVWSYGAKASPEPNAAGWWNTDVTATWECSDVTSGAKEPAGSVTFTTEGGERGIPRKCEDNAGNGYVSTIFVAGWFLIDKTAPTLAPTLSSTAIYVDDVVTTSPNATDARSGLVSQSCDPVVTSAPGAFSVSCTAKDKADNVATKSVSYTVVKKFDFGGFTSPIAATTMNSASAGSTVPVKFSLSGYQGLAIFTAGSPSSRPKACPTSGSVSTVGASTAKAGTSSLTYDPLTDTYTYLWKSEKSWAGTCRTLVVTLTDGIERTADFQFKR